MQLLSVLDIALSSWYSVKGVSCPSQPASNAWAYWQAGGLTMLHA